MIKKVRFWLNRFAEVSELGSDPVSKCVVFLESIYLLLALKLKLPGFRFRWNLSIFDKKYRILVSSIDTFYLIEEVFVHRVYDRNLPKHADVIFDLGSNVGISLLFFAAKYQGVTIYACEPAPETRAELYENIAGIPNIHVYPYAIAEKDGETSFYINDRHLSSSIFPRGGVNEHKVKVPVRSLKSFFDECGKSSVDILKFDVEGAEYGIFKSFYDWQKVGYIIGEVHYDLMQKSRQEFLSTLDAFTIKEEIQSTNRDVITGIRKLSL